MSGARPTRLLDADFGDQFIALISRAISQAIVLVHPTFLFSRILITQQAGTLPSDGSY